MFKRIALIGIGLIASSIAHAVRRSELANEIVGHTQSQKSTDLALKLNIADQMYDTPEDAAAGADLVILCTPVNTFAELARRIGPALKPGAIVSDVGSVKQTVIDMVAPHIPGHAHFVPAHPLAGTEQSGPTAGFAELFEERWCLITPLADSDEQVVTQVADFWKALGSNIDYMDAQHHDIVLAVTSHVPHLIAYTMVGTVEHIRRIQESEVIRYSAAGFRDFTRIAASDPTMWRDVFLANRTATLDILGRFTEELFTLQRAIRTGQGDILHDYFTRTRSIRREIIEAKQDIATPDFGRHQINTDE